MHKTSGIIAAIILMTMFSGVVAVAQELDMPATVEISLSVIPYAQLTFGETEIVLDETWTGLSSLSTAANFPYAVNAHWLAGTLTSNISAGSLSLLGDFASGFRPAGRAQGTLNLAITWAGTQGAETGDGDGATGTGEMPVYYYPTSEGAKTALGTVQVTVSPQNPGG